MSEKFGGESCVAILDEHFFSNFRASKLFPGTLLLSSLACESLRVKSLLSTLALIAGIVYQMNANHSRPDNGSAGQTIQKTVYPLTNDPTHSFILVKNTNPDTMARSYPDGYSYAPGGVLYLRDIRLPQNTARVRFIQPDTLPLTVYQAVFGCRSGDVEQFLQILSDVDEEQKTEVRQALFNRVSSLPWIPATRSDRLWDTVATDKRSP